MPKLGDLFPSNYLKSSDFSEEEDTIYTIKELKSQTLGQGKDAEDKYVMYFDEVTKGMVLNKTNAKVIATLYGDDTDDWEGKKIALYLTEVEFNGETMLGIRVRKRTPKIKSESKAAAVSTPAPGKAAAAAPTPIPADDDGDVPF